MTNSKTARARKIAFLVPNFNGGALLQQTLASASEAGLPPDQYEYVVCDNVSTDGSLERLPAVDANGAPIHVRRNETNVGRVPNWNRCLEYAEELGLGFATFLMAGDVVRGAGIVRLRDNMEHAGADFGMAYYDILDQSGEFVRSARRMIWKAAPAGMNPSDLIRCTVARGSFLLGQVQANLYRLDAANPLRFDPSRPTTADHLASTLFAFRSGKPVVYLDEPVFGWRLRGGRFHSTLDPVKVHEEAISTLKEVEAQTGIPTDWPKFHATEILRAFYHWTERPRVTPVSPGRLVKLLARCVFQRHGVSVPWLASMVYGRLTAGTSYVVESDVRQQL